MADNTVRSEIAFAVDADNEKEAREKVHGALDGAGFDVTHVGGVSHLIDYLPGEYLVHAVIEHAENEFDDLAGHAKKLYDDLVDAGIKPHSLPGSGFLAPDDSRLQAARPKESSLLDDRKADEEQPLNESRLVPAASDPQRDDKSSTTAPATSGDAGAAGVNA